MKLFQVIRPGRVTANMPDPLVILQLLFVAVPLFFVGLLSLKYWIFLDSPHGWTFDNYRRLLHGLPLQGYTNTLLTIATGAIVSSLAGLVVAVAVVLRPRLTVIIFATTLLPSYLASPLRSEGWRAASVLLGTTDVSWFALPAMVSIAAPFAAIAIYFRIQDMSLADLHLARIMGTSRWLAFSRLVGWPVLVGLLSGAAFASIATLMDFSTVTSLFRGSVYFHIDDMASRFSVQAWSEIAAHATAIAVLTSLLIVVANYFFSQHRPSQRHTDSKKSFVGFVSLSLAAVLSVLYLPLVGILVASFSASEFFTSTAEWGSLRWWGDTWQNSRAMLAVAHTLTGTIVVLSLAIPLGIATATIAWRKNLDMRFHQAHLVIWFLPWICNPLALGLSIGLISKNIGISLGPHITFFYHVLLVAPIISFCCFSRLRTITRADIALAELLAVPPGKALATLLRRPLIQGTVLGILISLGVLWTETQFSELTLGSYETVPVMLKAAAKSGGTPQMNVIGTIFVTVPIVTVLFVLGLQSRYFARSNR